MSVATPLLCAACSQPIGAMEPHVRQAVLELDATARKGEFDAICMACYARLSAVAREEVEGR